MARSKLILVGLAFWLACAAACVEREPASPCQGVARTKGPYVQRVTTEGATLRWESTARGCVEATVAREGGAARVVSGIASPSYSALRWELGTPHDVPGIYYVNQIDITGLEPGRCYRYEIDAPIDAARAPAEDSRASGRFCTARPPGEIVRFAAIGDTNPLLGSTEGSLRGIRERAPDFVLHLGDVQYYASVAETWAFWFSAMSTLLRTAAFYPSVGNHEEELDDDSELVSSYGRLFSSPSGDPRDTTRNYHHASGGVHFFALDTESTFAPGSAQRVWLESALERASASPDYRFGVAYQHRPMYSLSGDARRSLRPQLEPLFDRYGVRVVLAGHAHVYERFDVRGRLHIVSGGGGGLVGNVNEEAARYPEEVALRAAAASRYHAVVLEVRATEIVGEAFANEGETLDRFTFPVPAPR